MGPNAATRIDLEVAAWEITHFRTTLENTLGKLPLGKRP